MWGGCFVRCLLGFFFFSLVFSGVGICEFCFWIFLGFLFGFLFCSVLGLFGIVGFCDLCLVFEELVGMSDFIVNW